MKAPTFTSADGSTRCMACHLHPDLCNCKPTELKVPTDWLYGARDDLAKALRELSLVYTERDEHWAAAVDLLKHADWRLRNMLDPKNQLPF